MVPLCCFRNISILTLWRKEKSYLEKMTNPGDQNPDSSNLECIQMQHNLGLQYDSSIFNLNQSFK